MRADARSQLRPSEEADADVATLQDRELIGVGVVRPSALPKSLVGEFAGRVGRP